MGETTTGMDLYSKDLMKAEPSIRSLVVVSESIKELTFNAQFISDIDDTGTELGSIIIDLQFVSDAPYSLGMRIGNINIGGDTPVAQFVFDQGMPEIIKGKNIFRFKIPIIQLSKGNYTLGLIVYDKSNKILLINLKNIYEFEFHENRRYGSHYALTAVTCD
jgi:hypothetical protein